MRSRNRKVWSSEIKKRGVQNFAKSGCNDNDLWANHLIILYFQNDSHGRLTI